MIPGVPIDYAGVAVGKVKGLQAAPKRVVRMGTAVDVELTRRAKLHAVKRNEPLYVVLERFIRRGLLAEKADVVPETHDIGDPVG